MDKMNRHDTIAEYYPRIDAGDVDWVLALFAEDAVYDRADQRIEGAARLDRFYTSQRKISGVHTIDNIFDCGDHVIVVGQFSGVGEAGDARVVRFADIWHFDEDDKISHRQTFLALGQEYVRA